MSELSSSLSVCVKEGDTSTIKQCSLFCQISREWAFFQQNFMCKLFFLFSAQQMMGVSNLVKSALPTLAIRNSRPYHRYLTSLLINLWIAAVREGEV